MAVAQAFQGSQWVSEGKPKPIRQLSWPIHLLVFAVACLLIVSRRPDALFNPGFYAEDGAVWFRDAYNRGWFHSLSFPEGGYLNTLPRLISAIALLVPFSSVPLLMNWFGIAIQALPVNVLLSRRCINWGSLGFRTLMAVIYVALPNSSEIDVTITDAHFHLALAALLLAFGTVPETIWWKIADLAIFTVSGLTGPFSLVLLPLELVFWFVRKRRWYGVIFGVLALGGLTQIAELVLAGSSGGAGRPALQLGASPAALVRLISGQIFLGALTGGNHFGPKLAVWELVIVAALCTAVLGYCFVRAELQWKLLIIFSAALLGGALWKPLVPNNQPAWNILLFVNGMRYWFFPMLTFLWSAAWCASRSPNRVFQFSGMAVLFVSLMGAAKDWRYPAYADMKFPIYAAKLEAAAPGTVVTIPVYPNPIVATLTKVKHGCEVPSGFLDEPAQNAVITSSETTVRGWAAGDRGTRVAVLVDGRSLLSTGLTVMRPDVNRAMSYPQDQVAGWQATLDTRPLSPGKHTVDVRVRTSEKCDFQMASRTIRIQR